jgi:hypothetical protein
MLKVRFCIHTHPHQHLHHNAGDSGHAPVDRAFLERVASALSTAGANLVTGPASAKNELIAHIKAKEPALFKKISRVETLDHPSGGALVAFARRFFKADNRCIRFPSIDSRLFCELRLPTSAPHCASAGTAGATVAMAPRPTAIRYVARTAGAARRTRRRSIKTARGRRAARVP